MKKHDKRLYLETTRDKNHAIT